MFQLPTEDFLPLLSSFGISPDDGQLGAFAAYGDFLLDYNEKVNLTPPSPTPPRSRSSILPTASFRSR
ncbi:hypothetical protein CE91St46_37060 [Eubacteriales bacterium]|nr:hypothetical protein CE91St46_37060 [Eubacteriales bacterium]GKH65315.1 hypothetical protein CE91St47_37840 [Eubacteriales bacterium]